MGEAMSEEWGPWIEHDGKGCPCGGSFVEFEAGIWDRREVRMRGFIACVSGKAGWKAGDYKSKKTYEVIRYRIRKPKGLTILEGLLTNLPEDVDA
jgi:hypothetical protein